MDFNRVEKMHFKNEFILIEVAFDTISQIWKYVGQSVCAWRGPLGHLEVNWRLPASRRALQ